MNALFSFKGRINRASFWWSQLALVGIGVGMGVVAAIIGAALDSPGLVIPLALVVLATGAAIIWASFAVAAKRSHDLGHSGWLSLLTLVPFVGWLFWFYLGFAAGQASDNSYGPVPTNA